MYFIDLGAGITVKVVKIDSYTIISWHLQTIKCSAENSPRELTYKDMLHP